jgi:hypothetical protein
MLTQDYSALSDTLEVSVDYVTCPTCQGSKEVLRRKHLSPCLACRAQGVVDYRRVCRNCGQWRNCCVCPAGVHSEFTPPRLVPRPRPAYLQLVPQRQVSTREKKIHPGQSACDQSLATALRPDSRQSQLQLETNRQWLLRLPALWLCPGAAIRNGWLK